MGAEVGRLDQRIMAANLLLQSRGFGLAILDFAEVLTKDVRQIPLTTWFGLRRAELIPASKLQIINDCGHVPTIEKPEAMARILLNLVQMSTVNMINRSRICPPRL